MPGMKMIVGWYQCPDPSEIFNIGCRNMPDVDATSNAD